MIATRHAGWCVSVGLLGLLVPYGGVRADDLPPTGFQPQVKVSASTRLDWQFACAEFGADAAKLPREYDSTSQRYQLYVPKKYDKEKAWPLVLFISPGDDPAGWPSWQNICEANGCFFCAAYGAGNLCKEGQRTRIVLDAFDDVRRRYRIDPNQTCISGFSGGGRMACTIGFALSELFGSVVPICGTNPLPQASYIRHRVLDRVSVAFVTGEKDFNRKENEDYMYPMFQDFSIRSKLWVVPGMQHGIPSAKVLAEVYDWLGQDLKRRQLDAKNHPLLTVKPEEAPTREQLAARLLEAGELELKTLERTWRGVALLQGVSLRGDRSEAGPKAKKRLEELLNNPKKAALIEEQGGKEERLTLSTQARALERFGQVPKAIKAWEMLAENQPDSKEGKQAVLEIKRLKAASSTVAYLGVGFDGDTTIVSQVVHNSPADKAGIRTGDKLLTWDKKKLATDDEVRDAVKGKRPGDKVTIELERGGKKMQVTVELGMVPTEK